MTRRAQDEEFPEFQGRGWSFGFEDGEPKAVTLDPRWGRIDLVAGQSDIEQAIAIIIFTAPGERVMRPDFGCGIHQLIFDAISPPLIQSVKNTVTEALNRHEARIDVLKVAVGTQEVRDGRLCIDVHYRVRSTNQVGNLVYPFQFREAS